MRYFGGKNLEGVYQRIINQVPPHCLYVEPFAGSAAILRHKRPAEKSIAIDLDPGALDAIRDAVPTGTELLCTDGLRWLVQHRSILPTDAVIYCDPPYLPETRISGKRYRCELTPRDHKVLLGILLGLPCRVLLSGYRSQLYDERLAGWRRIEFDAITRGGWKAVECLWMNYPEPVELHDYRYLGADFREREKLTRQQRRWVRRLSKMDLLQRRALLAALAEVPGLVPSPIAVPGKGARIEALSSRIPSSETAIPDETGER